MELPDVLEMRDTFSLTGETETATKLHRINKALNIDHLKKLLYPGIHSTVTGNTLFFHNWGRTLSRMEEEEEEEGEGVFFLSWEDVKCLK